jgi:hypothetical protein
VLRVAVRLPYLTHVCAQHVIRFGAGEGFAELGHVGERFVRARGASRMRIGFDGFRRVVFMLTLGPDLGKSEEEPLSGRVSVDLAVSSVVRGSLERFEGERWSSERFVPDQRTIPTNARGRFIGADSSTTKAGRYSF